jgi:vacuolar-type H+-ATPase subunit I/STV1
MTQEQINVILVLLPITIPFVQFLLTKYFSKPKDTAEYSSDLLKITNDATEALRKARDELNAVEEASEKTIAAIRREHEAAIASIRQEYDGRHERLKARILELERVQKVYAIQFDLVTHPNVEIRNMTARSMDDVSASQKIKAITEEDLKNFKKE